MVKKIRKILSRGKIIKPQVKVVTQRKESHIIIEGEDLHIQKLDVSSGELTIEGEIYSFCYTGSAQGGKASKGFFKKMLR